MSQTDSWLKISIQAESAAHEALENFFFELGSSGTEEEADCVTGYFSDVQSRDSIKSAVVLYVSSLRSMQFQISDPEISMLPAEDWSVQWHRFFHPVEVTSQIVVKPPWETWPAKQNQIVIDITPQMAFGTGTHETTQICLQLLQDRISRDDLVLDVGTGSGILGIAAIRLGAKRVTALDIDADAVPNAKENAVRNHVADNMTILCGTIDSVHPAPFDLVLANINRLVLEKLIPQIGDYVHSGSHLIFSGILTEERSKMETLFQKNRFEIIRCVTKGEWDGYIVQ